MHDEEMVLEAPQEKIKMFFYSILHSTFTYIHYFSMHVCIFKRPSSFPFFSWQFLAEIFVKYAERCSANFFIPSSNACVIYKDNKNSVFLNFFLQIKETLKVKLDRKLTSTQSKLTSIRFSSTWKKVKNQIIKKIQKHIVF